MGINASVMVLNVNDISPIVGQAVNRILMEGQGLSAEASKKLSESGEN